MNSGERCDADGDGVLPGADGTRGPWQRTLAGNGCIGGALVPVSRGRAGGAARGATDSVACATILGTEDEFYGGGEERASCGLNKALSMPVEMWRPR